MIGENEEICEVILNNTTLINKQKIVMNKYIMLSILSVFFLIGCTTVEDPIDNTKEETGKNEFTIDGKTYQIGITRWSTLLNSIMPSDESSLGALWMSFPDSVKLGTYKYTDGLFLKVTSGDLPVYHAKYDEVNVTITKIGSLGSYGGGNIEGTFSGTFYYFTTDANDMVNGGGEVQLSAKFATTAY